MGRPSVTDKAQRHRREHEGAVENPCPESHLCKKRLFQQHGRAVDHQDLTEQGKPLPEHLIDNIFFRMGQKPHKSFLDHMFPSLFCFFFSATLQTTCQTASIGWQRSIRGPEKRITSRIFSRISGL